jgi:sec-independent protein translocase protein TatC
MSAPEKPDEAPEAESSLISHLLELRNRLVYAFVSIGAIFFVLVIFFSNDIYALLAKPLLAALPAGASMIATEVTSPFLTPLRLTLAASVVLAVPFVLYQVWAFVAPGLYRHEKRLALPLLVSSILLFYCGMAFAYFVVFPAAFKFFAGSAPEGVTMMTDIKAYLDFVFAMFFAFGIAFEVPVAVVILVRMGVVNPDTLANKRAYVFLWTFVVAAVLTPPDVGSQVMLALPMYALFEMGLIVARMMRPRAADPDRPDGTP